MQKGTLYEAMLDELEGDLDVIHTVPLDQVKKVLSKWVKDSGYEGSHIWVVQRPLYGLRESPVIWAEFRNAKLKKLKVVVKGKCLRLTPLVSEAEVWLLKDEISGELYDILVIYVDDLMCLADKIVIEELHKEIMNLWPTSELEWVGPNKTARYLGVEIRYHSDSRAYSISQQAYIAELLRTQHARYCAHTTSAAKRMA